MFAADFKKDDGNFFLLGLLLQNQTILTVLTCSVKLQR